MGIEILRTPEKDLNMLTYNDYYTRLALLANTMFKWNNLPNDIPEKFIEKVLFNWGRCVIVNDENLGIMAARCTPSGQLNHYDEPISITAYGTNYTKEYNTDDTVVIRNNAFDVPTSFSIRLFASRLAEVERTIDVNIKTQKTPVIVLVDEKERLTMTNLMKKYDGNIPFIFGSKSLNLDSIKTLKLDNTYLADQLMIYKHDVWNEAMSFLGIQNANTDKRERLITDEVTANNELVMLSASVMFKMREQACDEINKKFGTNVSVELRAEQDVYTAMGTQTEDNTGAIMFNDTPINKTDDQANKSTGGK